MARRGDLILWDIPRPELAPFGMLRRQMERLFEDFLPEAQGKGAGVAGYAFTPKVTVTEDEREVLVTCELPGIEKEDVQIELLPEAVVLRGEKKWDHETNEKGIHLVERAYGKFERMIPLYAEVDQDKIDATFKNGVATIHLPKTAKAKEQTKKIALRAG